MLDSFVPLIRIDLYWIGPTLLGCRERPRDGSAVLLGRQYVTWKWAIL
jgi:hypothetical protein